MYLIFHATTQDYLIMKIMKTYERELIKVNHHFNKFGSHKHCGSGDLNGNFIFGLSHDPLRPRNRKVRPPRGKSRTFQAWWPYIRW